MGGQTGVFGVITSYEEAVTMEVIGFLGCL